MNFIPYGHQSISEEDIQAVALSLKNDMITRGPLVAAFEEAVAKYVEAAYAVAFTSGSTALNAAYLAAEITSKDRVLTTPNTFIATSAAASMALANVTFVDIDQSSGNMNLEELEPHLNFRSLKGKLFIVPVHFSGIAVDMQSLYQIATASNIITIEDAAHAIGSFYPDGKKVGSGVYSDMTVFSFHPVKNITTGEGGMVTTNSFELYQKLKFYRNSGIVRDEQKGPWYYEVKEFSSNYHMTDFQAALGISQLKRLDFFVEKRRSLVARYRKNLRDISSITLFDSKADSYTAFHLMVVQIDFQAFKKTRKEVMEVLKNKGIGTQVHYIPLYRHPCYKNKINDELDQFPQMEGYYERALTLPLYVDLTENDVDRVCKILLEALQII